MAEAQYAERPSLGVRISRDDAPRSPAQASMIGGVLDRTAKSIQTLQQIEQNLRNTRDRIFGPRPEAAGKEAGRSCPSGTINQALDLQDLLAETIERIGSLANEIGAV